ncbi:hypothetical protein KOW79_005049 [Hemibagrus wyckioides]|uniref:Uncharacterized protein n=1 Tax=Hemibagrus wyckioides TaxID=337641 RepID=A0A9D3P190_9TELE|nr:hypothetical protein KOW79_005049 [Hemibagrus wyckioides]
MGLLTFHRYQTRQPVRFGSASTLVALTPGRSLGHNTSPAACCTSLLSAPLGMDGGDGRKQELAHHGQMVKFLAPSSLAGMI